MKKCYFIDDDPCNSLLYTNFSNKTKYYSVITWGLFVICILIDESSKNNLLKTKKK